MQTYDQPQRLIIKNSQIFGIKLRIKKTLRLNPRKISSQTKHASFEKSKRKRNRLEKRQSSSVFSNRLSLCRQIHISQSTKPTLTNHRRRRLNDERLRLRIYRQQVTRIDRNGNAKK